MNEKNLGDVVVDWQGAKPLSGEKIIGDYSILAPVSADAPYYIGALFESFADDVGWDYLPYGPFASEQEFNDWFHTTCLQPDPFFYAVINKQTDAVEGMLSYLNINPTHGSVEVGHIHFSPSMQRTTQATEAIYLTMKHAFADLGYRRFEWKCNNLNATSKRAAERFGFSYEGCFRQMMVVKGRNRDTVWYSIIDKEWQDVKNAFETWLAPSNFDADGRQKQALQELYRHPQEKA